MRKLLRFLVDLAVLMICLVFLPFVARCQYVTITGTLQGSNGLPAQNYSISFTPTQWFFIAGTGVTINTTSYCATSIDGSTVGVLNPLQVPVVTPGFSGTLPASNYYVEYTWYTGSTQTLPSPEQIANLTATGQLNIVAPTFPPGATSMQVYIGTTSGSETLQGSSLTSSYVQSVPLVSATGPPGANTTICKQVANDAGWPTGTGYQVALTDTNGNTLPGYPMVWQLLGPNTTINLSNGLPYYHGVVTYPIPILASPLNHAGQSISGPVSLTGYNLVNVGELGVGTSLPAWGVDVEGSGNAGRINANLGYLLGGVAPPAAGHCIISSTVAYDTDSTCITSLPVIYYQTVLNGSTAGTAVAQRLYFAVGTGTGLLATDVVGVGSQVSRTVLDLNAIGGSTSLGLDPYAVITAAGGTATHLAAWDATLGGLTDAGPNPVISRGHLGTTSCTTGSSTYSTCTSVVTIAPAQADTSYIPVCSGATASDPRAAINGCIPTSTSTVTVTVVTEGSVAVNYSDLYVIVSHP